MKKLPYIKTIFLGSLAFILLGSYSGGVDDNYSGSPNSGGTCGNCHGGGSNSGGIATLTGLPATFVGGQNYSITLSFSIPSTTTAIRAGFQIEALDAAGANYGTLVAGNGSRDAMNAVGLLTHDGPNYFATNGPNKEVSWTFSWLAPATQNSSSVSFYFVVNCTNGDGGTSGDNVYAGSLTVPSASGASQNLKLAAKVYLSNYDPGTGLMDDYLRSDPSFPLSDPYATAPLNATFTHVNNGTTASTTQSVLNTIGQDAIVEWLFLELRTGNPGATSVTQTKTALLQRDGDIVAMDGISALEFSAPVGSYYIAVRHRNHLGFRTANTIALSSTTTALNLSNNSVALYGLSPMVAINGSLNKMNGGDANSDGSIDAFDSIEWENQNGLFMNAFSLNADYNLDGSVDALDSIIWEISNGLFEELN
ncbi:MAG: choice-of-anchor V domain-containing protein [Saprospiraceae bacterium]